LATSVADFGASGGLPLLFWAVAALAVRQKAAIQNTAKNRRNLTGNGIFPPVLMEFARPMSGFMWDQIGTLIRRRPPAARLYLPQKSER
jgi:hypothetical protein